ncbi:hypothetical protein [Posidoniimonas polymericola]|nr:hypothetical protein [Posidoniimonas polymericola]
MLSYKGVPDWSEKDDQILAEIAASRRSATWRESPESGDAE